MISLNITLIFQIIVFLTFIWILNRFLFKPVLNVLDERLEKTEGLKKKANAIEEEVKEKREGYESKLKEAKEKTKEIKNGLKKEGLYEEKKIVNNAAKEMKEVIEEGKGEIFKEIEQVKTEMEKERKDISHGIAEKVLGRSID